jgi:3'-phosphoadenosine 5'-phosphosulfate sulfotransferase (PAPS reductase)/FAD synthetase
MLSITSLRQKQSLQLNEKIILSKHRIKEFKTKLDNIFVSFSGGIDSLVLLHLTRQLYPDTPAVFSDTGLEFPEVREFVKTIPNVITIRPKMSFRQVIEQDGYPVISKEIAQIISDLRRGTPGKTRDKRRIQLPQSHHYLLAAPFKISHLCCQHLKKSPFNIYIKETNSFPLIGTRAEESRLRETAYLKHGCNNFNKNQSTPLSFWTNKDIWDYIKLNNIPYCELYDQGWERTGCVFCLFGPDAIQRFEKIKYTHPQLYKYCIEKLNMQPVIDFLKSKGYLINAKSKYSEYL